MNTGLARFNKYIRKYWKQQAIVVSLGLLTSWVGLTQPYLGKLVIDKAYGNRDLKLFLILSCISAGIFLFNGISNYFQNYLSQYINKKVNFDMTKDLFRHLGSLPLSFFNDKSTGEHLFRIGSDVGAVSSFICNTTPEVIKVIPQLIFTLIIVFYLNWRMALFALLLVPFSLLQPYLFGKWLKDITRKMIERSESIFRGLEEVFSHIHLVKALGKEDYEAKRFEEALLKEIDFDLKTSRISNISNFAASILNKLITGAIALYGGYQLIKGRLTLGSLTAIMIYTGQLIGLINSIGRLQESFIVNSVSRERLSSILDIKPQIQDKVDAKDFPVLEGRVEFKDVYFGYKKEEPVLKGISFAISPAAKIALVGPSGCGKTTLLALLLRLHELQGGSILIDGLDVREFKNESLKRQVSVVLQEPFLWNASIKDNILYAKENASMDEVERAARIAQAHDFISRLAQGYDTQVGEYACKVSDGQKQRIAIARAVMNKTKILVFDEAMSSLDSQTEDRIIDNIRAEFSDSTVLIVSHRLSTAQKMDLVYFLESPSNMLVGTHQNLIEKNSKYRELFSSQIKPEEQAYEIKLTERGGDFQ